MVKEIKVEIDEDGNVTLDINGVQGNSCLLETKALEEALGLVEKREKKPSFYARIQTNRTTRNSR